MPSDDRNLSRRRFTERSIEFTGAGVLAGVSLEEQALLAHAQGPARVISPAAHAFRRPSAHWQPRPLEDQPSPLWWQCLQRFGSQP